MNNFSSPPPWLSSSSSSRNVKARVGNPDWTALPFNLLLSVSKHLPTRTDIRHFRVVCLSFIFAVPSPPKIPFPTSKLSISHPIIGPLRMSRSNFILSYSTVYAIKPLHKIIYTHKTAKTWLVRVTELSSGLLRVEDPLCPGLFEALRLPKVLDTLKYHVTEIARVYTIEVDSPERRSGVFNKAVVSTGLGGKDEFSAMAIHRQGKLQFYVVGETGLTISVDTRSLSVTHVVFPLQNLNLGTRHLVKSPNDLFLVVKYVNVLVFKLDFRAYEWVKVRNELDKRVLFTGDHDYYPGMDTGIFDLTTSYEDSIMEFPGYSMLFW
ncbi:F-box protein SKIP23-like [Pistacia vera]|uniref:F-box protein SKIP23-like n=1 Tax=Pistacia vera TaxID=55513 RepID=UPI001263156D|nr:F-box protein SKIP23-like [Pistacia vera]